MLDRSIKEITEELKYNKQSTKDDLFDMKLSVLRKNIMIDRLITIFVFVFLIVFLYTVFFIK